MVQINSSSNSYTDSIEEFEVRVAQAVYVHSESNQRVFFFTEHDMRARLMLSLKPWRVHYRLCVCVQVIWRFNDVIGTFSATPPFITFSPTALSKRISTPQVHRPNLLPELLWTALRLPLWAHHTHTHTRTRAHSRAVKYEGQPVTLNSALFFIFLLCACDFDETCSQSSRIWVGASSPGNNWPMTSTKKKYQVSLVSLSLSTLPCRALGQTPCVWQDALSGPMIQITPSESEKRELTERE